MTWETASRCESSGCVEVDSTITAGKIKLRNSTQPEIVLEFSPDAWVTFLNEAPHLTQDWMVAND